MGAYRQRIRLRADLFEDSEIRSETDEGVISVGCESRDRQPGLREARRPKLPYPALDSRQSAILYKRPWLNRVPGTVISTTAMGTTTLSIALVRVGCRSFERNRL